MGEYRVVRHAWQRTLAFFKAQLAIGVATAITSVAFTQPWRSGDQAKWRLVLDWAVLVLGPIAVVFVLAFLWHCVTAPYQLVSMELASLREEVTKATAKKPERTLDPVYRQLLLNLEPLLEQGQFLMQRRATGRSFDSPEFRSDVRIWSEEVSSALDGFPSYKEQFDSDPAMSLSDVGMSKSGTSELEHRMGILTLIMESALRR